MNHNIASEAGQRRMDRLKLKRDMGRAFLAWATVAWGGLFALGLLGWAREGFQGPLSVPLFSPPWAEAVYLLVGFLLIGAWVRRFLSLLPPLPRRAAALPPPNFRAMDPWEFEVWTGMLFRSLGYKVQNVRDRGDHGVDLRIWQGNGLRGIVQCKHVRGTVGEGVVRDLYGTLVHEQADVAFLVTSGRISRAARIWARGKPIGLWDGRTIRIIARKVRGDG